ncbi:META domain-containing protein [Glutamicibacter sp. PS]|uniref:META domain-containing protein n=1 Tax=Glutamicibacter sp. PS TaxID=3075634 RepID=UPI002846FC01|nr:META domain-containing protein [Glutamicibacter sp. PS]MDR4533102.1 META domain-containing protein [Glutamicibacter sp. PS]
MSGSAEGTWGVKQRGEPWLQLAAEGRILGNDGCNRLMGGWRVDGPGVRFEPLASTLMYCEGVDTWLSTAVTALVEDDELVVFDAEGREIGRLPRVAESD